MLDNVLDIDCVAQRFLLKHERSAILLWDFCAAFPSLSHACLFEVLNMLGILPGQLHAIKSLYSNVAHMLVFDGKLLPSFVLRGGVRQGCPLSPLLFVLVLDIFLRYLRRQFQGDLFRGYADDLACVTSDVVRDWPRLILEFQLWARASGLDLNIKKCVCIPLWTSNLEETRREAWFQESTWRDFILQTTGKYLGFWIGPGGTAVKHFEGPMEKFEHRCAAWLKAAVGLSDKMYLFNVMCLSLLCFPAQLVEATPEVRTRIDFWQQKFAGGPWNWITAADLRNLKALGFKNQMHDFDVVCRAAKFRVIYGPGGLKHGVIFDRCEQIRKCRARCEDFGRLSLHDQWKLFGFTQVLCSNADSLRSSGITNNAVRTAIIGNALGASRTLTWQELAKIRQNFQRTTVVMLRANLHYNWEARIRHKLENLFPRTHPSYQATRQDGMRVMQNMQRVCKLLPPRVLFAQLHTIFNGWCTSQRFGRKWRPCPLCIHTRALGALGYDTLAHMPYCRVTKGICERLGISVGEWSLRHMLLMVKGLSDQALCRLSLVNYGTYVAYNFASHTTVKRHLQSVVDSAMDHIREATVNTPLELSVQS